jgi:tetratricopeptide (TPR) repeat protein
MSDDSKTFSPQPDEPIGVKPELPASPPAEPFPAGAKVDLLHMPPLVSQGILSDRGGFGRVYKLWDPVQGRFYAMKVPRSSHDPRERREFLDEARRLLLLVHPNIVRAVCCDEVNGLAVLVTELVDGGTLARYWDAHPSSRAFSPSGSGQYDRADSDLPASAFLSLFIEIARGMRYVWREASITHFDLKPENIVLDSNGIPKILDFGLSRTIAEHAQRVSAEDPKNFSQGPAQAFSPAHPEPAGTDRGTRTAALPRTSQSAAWKGTLGYMAPEQFEGFARCDTRADIYALGVIMYELTAKRRLFPPSAYDKTAAGFRRLQATTVVSEVPGCDQGLARIILRCLSLRPEQRYPTFEELTAALEEAYRQQTGREYRSDDRSDDRSGDPEEMAARALNLMNIDQEEDGLRLVEKALRLAPDSPSVLIAKAFGLRRVGRYQDALILAKRAYDRNPDDDGVLTECARVYDSVGANELAVELRRRILELHPDGSGVHCSLARSLSRLGRHAEARVEVERALSEHADSETAISAMVTLYADQADFAGGLKWLESWLSTDWNGFIHEQAAVLAQKAGDLPRATAFAERAVELDPYSYGFWTQLGFIHWKAERKPEALAALRRALDENPCQADTAGCYLYYLGKLGQEKEGRQFMKSWSSRYPLSAGAIWLINVALFEDALGNTDAALAAYDAAIELDPSDQDYFVNKLRCLTEAGRATEALALAKTWLDDPTHVPNARFHNVLGLAYGQLKEYDTALGCLGLALAASPADAVYASNKVSLLREAERSHDAVDFATEWLAAPGHVANAPLHNQLGLVHGQLKDHDAALRCFHLALALSPGNATYAGRKVDSLRQADRAQEAVDFGQKWLASADHVPNASFQNALFLVFLDLRLFDDAIRYYDIALSRTPADTQVAGFKVTMLRQAGRAKEAIDFGQKWLASADHVPNASFQNALFLLFLDLGLFDDAIRYYDIALSRMPADTQIAGFKVTMLGKAGRFEDALEFAQGWLATTGHTPNGRFYLALGRAQAELKRHDDALCTYDLALALSPGDADTAAEKVDCLRLAGRSEDALKFAREWLATASHTPNASFHLRMFQVHDQLKQYGDALRSCDLALALRPTDADTASIKIGCLRKAGRFEDALGFAQQWLASTDHIPNARLFESLALVQAELKRHDDAQSSYDRALALSPSDAGIATNKLASLRQAARSKEAIDFAQRWLATPGHTPNALFYDHLNHLGLTQYQMKRYDDAVRALDLSLRLRPGAADIAALKLLSLREANHPEEGIAFAEQWLAAGHIANAALYNHMGLAQAALKRHGDAIRSYDLALGLTPDDPDIATNKTSALRESGRHEEAIEFAEQWLTIAGHTPQAFLYTELARAYEASGRSQDAERCWSLSIANFLAHPFDLKVSPQRTIPAREVVELAAGWQPPAKGPSAR